MADAPMEDESYSLPRFRSAPSDAELLEHLRTRGQRYSSEPRRVRLAGVNYDIPGMEPWELPAGMAQGNTSDKYYVTNCFRLLFISSATSNGCWSSRGLGWAIPGKREGLTRFIGLKRTYDFHKGKAPEERTKTNWIMNVYYLLDDNDHVKHDLMLCHVFENKSADDYDPRPQCLCHQPHKGEGVTPSMFRGDEPLNHSCDQHPGFNSSYDAIDRGDGELCCNQATHDPGNSSNSLFGTAPRSSWSTHSSLNSDQPSDPGLTTYIAELEKTLLGDAGTYTKNENKDPNGGGPSTVLTVTGGKNSRKRTRIKNKSLVWQRFTKIYADGPEGASVLAVCNQCCKVLNGDSTNGTSHLRRHNCPCSH